MTKIYALFDNNSCEQEFLACYSSKEKAEQMIKLICERAKEAAEQDQKKYDSEEFKEQYKKNCVKWKQEHLQKIEDCKSGKIELFISVAGAIKLCNDSIQLCEKGMIEGPPKMNYKAFITEESFEIKEIELDTDPFCDTNFSYLQ